MPRTTNIISISLPRSLSPQIQSVAKKQGMTTSELFRAAIREYIERLDHSVAMKGYQAEKAAGTLRTLDGSLADSLQ